jgi:hypothetical protein
MLAQQASNYDVDGCNFYIQEQPMHENFSFFYAGADQSAKSTTSVSSADSLTAIAQSTKLIALVGQADSSKLAKPTALIGLADSPVASPITSTDKLPNWPDMISSDVRANLEYLRTPLLRYLHDPNAKFDKSVQ